MANSLAPAIAAAIAAAFPRPQIVEGTVAYIGDGRVTVTGVGDGPVPCDWSAAFDLELSALGPQLIGRPVVVHLIDGQPIIAYSKVTGVKP